MEVYLDHNATTPLSDMVLEAMMPFLTVQYGNPSSRHSFGRRARHAVDQAREQVAALAGAHPSQVIFTSGGTEANNLALKGAAAWLRPGNVALSAIEHPSVIEPVKALRQQNWSMREIVVDREGRVTQTSLAEAMSGDTRLVSVMYANNETGVIQDVATLSEFARRQGAVMHSDAVQAAGKLALDFAASGAQLMSLSAHKLYGPKGAGALVIDKSLELASQIQGGGQERGLRAGTENVAAIVGFGAAAELAQASLDSEPARLAGLRDRLQQALQALPGAVVFAAGAERLPNTLFFGVEGIDGEMLLMQLDQLGLAVASGSACSSDKVDPSHVLLAMGVEPMLARSAIRVSLGRGNDEADIDRLIEALKQILGRLLPGLTWSAAG
jgi:cysteine desulfurase